MTLFSRHFEGKLTLTDVTAAHAVRGECIAYACEHVVG
jgi:hypothetical protein